MLQIAPQLEFPEQAKPYIESLRGRLRAKVSPLRKHGMLQVALGSLIDAWARGKGDVATEWRFFLTDERGRFSTLLPDVAFMSYERLPRSTEEAIRERPTIAPDLAIEIVSPSDRTKDVAEKIEIYLATGSIIVLVVDYEARTIVAHDAKSKRIRTQSETFADERFPGLTIDLAALFARLD